jgi:hypothetical protein
MPGYTLKVHFRGLMVWVPSDDFDQPQDWIGAFLVNAGPQAVDSVAGDPRLKPHFPLVRFPLAALPGMSGRTGEGSWALQNEDLFIVPRDCPADAKLRTKYSRRVGTRPTKTQRDHLNWVPRLAALAAPATISTDCLEAQPREGRIVARVHLRQGTLLAEKLGIFDNKDILVEFFPKMNGGTAGRQVVAGLLVLEMNDLRSDLRLVARSFVDQTTRELVLQDPGDGKTLDIEVLNLCPDELQNIRPPLPGEDTDFLWNYRATDLWDPNPRVWSQFSRPVAVEFSTNGGGGGEYAHCTNLVAPAISQAQLAVMKGLAQPAQEGAANAHT